MAVRAVCMALLLLAMPALAQQAAKTDTEANPDPWEGFNRAMFQFNDTVDRYALLPVTRGYRAITPDPVENAVGRFFDNLREVRNVLNGLLQFKFGQAANDGGRFLINSTIGLLGFFDVAEPMGLKKGEGEDFGQTLGYWGLDSGPYLVLPFFGPSTLRDGPGLAVDIYTHPISEVDHERTRYGLTGMNFIDARAEAMDAEELIRGDRYSFIRDAYLQRRRYLVNDGQVEDTFGSDFGGGYGDDEYGSEYGGYDSDDSDDSGAAGD